MDQSKSFQKLIDRLILPKFNGIIGEYKLGEGVTIDVSYEGSKSFEHIGTDATEVYKVSIITTNPILSFRWFTEGYYALYNMLGNITEYLDPSRNFVLQLRVVLDVDGDKILMNSDSVLPFLGKSSGNYEGMIRRSLETIKQRYDYHGRRSYLGKFPPLSQF